MNYCETRIPFDKKKLRILSEQALDLLWSLFLMDIKTYSAHSPKYQKHHSFIPKPPF